ncbi:MAG TPA: phytanoyl-CoA dioxygenase family protein [Acidimicrobiales bacterium]|jgi:hypothetical protein|nr:phytanoyl-CoA dioxygenase family protein [Acidimicrobiales bacterium]
MSVLTAPLRQAWEVDGWCLIEGAVPADQLQSAQRAVAKLFPSAEDMAGSPDARDPRWSTWDANWPEFPFRSRTLNSLVVSDLVIDVAAELLGTDDVRMYLAIASAKYADQPSDYNRLLHVDFPNHTLTVPRAEPGYHQVELFVYLNDVSRQNGATHFVSRRHTHAIPVEEHTLNLDDYGALYEDGCDASGPAGSIVVYRPDVYHRSVDFSDPAQARFMLHVSYKPAGLEWGGYQAWPFKGFSAEWHAFVQGASPRQLAVLGFPEPGHVFWTSTTLDGVARRYPGLDLTPWRSALRSDQGLRSRD